MKNTYLYYMKSISDSVRNTRLKSNLNQNEFSELLNISPSHIKNIESGNISVSLDFLVKYANTYNLTIESILFSDKKIINSSLASYSYKDSILIMDYLYKFKMLYTHTKNEPTQKNNINYKGLSYKIKNWRKAKKISTETISEKLKISKKSYENIESDNAKPSLKTLISFANMTGIPLDLLLSDSLQNKNAAISYLMSEIFSDLNKYEHDAFINILNSLISLHKKNTAQD